MILKLILKDLLHDLIDLVKVTKKNGVPKKWPNSVPISKYRAMRSTCLRVNDTLLQPNDELFVLGPPEKIDEASGLLHNPEEREVSL